MSRRTLPDHCDFCTRGFVYEINLPDGRQLFACEDHKYRR
jgi:hypothetical protein